MLQSTSRGWRARSSSFPGLSREAAPGTRFCTKTSARSSSWSSSCAARGCLTSSVTDSFDRFSQKEHPQLPKDGLIEAVREVIAARALELDDTCTEVAELTGGERGGHGVLRGHDHDPVHGAGAGVHRLVSRLDAARMRRARRITG